MLLGLKNLKNFLSRHEKFIISTHESPDGDGLGAEIAFLETLLRLGKTAFILNSDPIPDKYKFIDAENGSLGNRGIEKTSEGLVSDSNSNPCQVRTFISGRDETK